MKFSVAMCTYNGARYIGEQLRSIAAQERPPEELVICDDGSTDETCRIIESFAARAPFPVRLHVNERNLGTTQNFGRAIGLCSGELIALSDQDDVWLPGKLRRLESEFLRAPEVGLIFTDAEVIDENSRPLGYRLWEKIGVRQSHLKLLRSGRALDELLPGSTATGATMAFRSHLRELVLPIPGDLALIHDGWIALVVAAVAEVSYVEEPLIKYRQHSRQQIGTREKKGDRGAQGLAGVKDAARRRNSYEEMIETAERARQRLAEHREAYDCREALARLDARRRHLLARSRLPAGRLSRVPCVLRELLSRRYHLYSNGVYSAVKDLLA